MNNNDWKEYINHMKVVFKDSKEYVNNYDINNHVFESFGFLDSSYSNDCTPSYTMMSHDEEKTFTIHFPNSNNDNIENEEFNTYCIYNSYCSANDGLMIFVETIDEVFSIIRSNQSEIDSYLNS
tara:strand:- start:555 stop:926 length:372 start_codon:yes stop_codon:yes gene_type:complete